MFEDIYKSTKQNIIERLSSPLIGSFVVAWGLWNYKFLVILFSNAGVTQTFNLVEKIAFPDATTIVLKGAVLPLATAILYIFIYPYPALKVYEFTLQRQRASNEVRQKIEDETLLTLEESRVIRANAIAREKELEESIDRLNKEISTLKADLQRSRKPAKKGLDLAEIRPISLEPLQLALLKALDQFNGRSSEAELIRKLSQPRVQTEFALGELVRLGFMETGFDYESNERTYEFTHEGRRALIQSAGAEPSS